MKHWIRQGSIQTSTSNSYSKASKTHSREQISDRTRASRKEGIQKTGDRPQTTLKTEDPVRGQILKTAKTETKEEVETVEIAEVKDLQIVTRTRVRDRTAGETAQEPKTPHREKVTGTRITEALRAVTETPVTKADPKTGEIRDQVRRKVSMKKM